MDALECIFARRSVRQFLPEPVPRQVLEKIVQAGVEAPTGCNMQLKQYLVVDDQELMGELRAFSKALTGAPAAIVLLVKPEATQYGEFWIQDASAAMENMLLMAVALGYAGCWVEGAIRRAERPLRELLGVPERLRVWSLTPIGKAVGPAKRPAKPELASVLHYNRFGQE